MVFVSVAATNIGTFMEVENYLDAGNLASAPFLNNTITPTNNEEVNLQTVYDVYINTWAVDTFYFDSTQFAMLDSIAYQKPITGGDAVYKARVMLGLMIDDFVDMDDAERLMRKNDSTSLTDNRFKLYPNPNNGMMELDYSLQVGDKGIIMIYDLTGRFVSDYILPNGNGTLSIDESKVNDGIYFYHIFVNGKIVLRDKLVIIK